jgi:PAS domain S-box-containing protein
MALVLLKGLSDPVYVVDREWRIVFCNDAFVHHMGVPREAVEGKEMWSTITPANRAALRQHYDRVLRTGNAETFVHASVLYPGRTVDIRVFPLFDGLGVMFRDISRRVAAERALAISEEHLRRALDGAEMGDWSWDSDSDEMTFSPRALIHYGLTEDHQGMTRETLRRDIVHPDDLTAIRATASTAHADMTAYDVEYRVRRGDGWRWMRTMGAPHIVDGKVLGLHGLVQDIHERKLASERLKAEIDERERGQQRQTLLIHELNHRVKNILAMVQAVAMQTLSNTHSPQAARRALEERLVALARAHDVLTRESWDGAELADIVAGAVEPYDGQTGRFRVHGPRVRLEPQTAVSLAMALHELVTNAIKYGSLSVEGGWVEIDWVATPSAGTCRLKLDWSEHGGPEVRPPARQGFGARLIPRSLAAEEGTATLSYPPDGARCRIEVTLPLLSGGETRIP